MDLNAFLNQHGIELTRCEHPAVMTVEESDRLVPKLPGAKTKNLFLRDGKGRRHLLVTIPGARSVDLGRLGEELGIGRLGFRRATAGAPGADAWLGEPARPDQRYRTPQSRIRD